MVSCATSLCIGELMKNIFALISLGFIFTAQTSFGADSTAAQILNHPVVQSIEKLLNEKHGGQCVVPTLETEIRWMCTGARMPVTAPKIMPSSCGFGLDITCPGETISISGNTRSYYLEVPAGQPNTVAPTDPLIIIGNVTYR
jgi:hypothetical protein